MKFKIDIETKDDIAKCRFYARKNTKTFSMVIQKKVEDISSLSEDELKQKIYEEVISTKQYKKFNGELSLSGSSDSWDFKPKD